MTTKTKKTRTTARYSNDYPQRLAFLALSSGGRVTEKMAAEEFGCAKATIQYWKREHPEFREAMRNPLSEDMKKVYRKAFDRINHGTTTTVTHPDGTQTITHTGPSAADSYLPVKMGMFRFDAYQKSLDKERLQEERQKMRPFYKQYEAEEITLVQLLNEYHFHAIDAPTVLIEQYSKELKLARERGEPFQYSCYLNLNGEPQEFGVDVDERREDA